MIPFSTHFLSPNSHRSSSKICPSQIQRPSRNSPQFASPATTQTQRSSLWPANGWSFFFFLCVFLALFCFVFGFSCCCCFLYITTSFFLSSLALSLFFPSPGSQAKTQISCIWRSCFTQLLLNRTWVCEKYNSFVLIHLVLANFFIFFFFWFPEAVIKESKTRRKTNTTFFDLPNTNYENPIFFFFEH